jgi:hypothetical protein
MKYEVRSGTHLELLVHRETRLGRAFILLTLLLHGSSSLAVRLRSLLVLLKKPLLFALKIETR